MMDVVNVHHDDTHTLPDNVANAHTSIATDTLPIVNTINTVANLPNITNVHEAVAGTSTSVAVTNDAARFKALHASEMKSPIREIKLVNTHNVFWLHSMRPTLFVRSLQHIRRFSCSRDSIYVDVKSPTWSNTRSVSSNF